MTATCECGMVLDQSSRRIGCQECGTACCRSCAIEFDTNPYCRWCAPTVRSWAR